MRAICVCLALLLALPVARAESGEYVRLHVVARSDTQEDQEAKLKARDAVLRETNELLTYCESAGEAFEIVKAHAEELAQIAGEAAGQTARAETGVFQFPERQYGNTAVPAGEYWALRIVLGEGKGQNWWCVLYPGMCVPENLETGPLWKRIMANWCIWREK